MALLTDEAYSVHSKIMQKRFAWMKESFGKEPKFIILDKESMRELEIEMETRSRISLRNMGDITYMGMRIAIIYSYKTDEEVIEITG
jgi:hypothetical protein